MVSLDRGFLLLMWFLNPLGPEQLFRLKKSLTPSRILFLIPNTLPFFLHKIDHDSGRNLHPDSSPKAGSSGSLKCSNWATGHSRPNFRSRVRCNACFAYAHKARFCLAQRQNPGSASQESVVKTGPPAVPLALAPFTALVLPRRNAVYDSLPPWFNMRTMRMIWTMTWALWAKMRSLMFSLRQFQSHWTRLSPRARQE
uniref:Uncharacterized protein n=1 Tax=Oryza nivara TaxID=4536 RepID=A0A0E0JAK5_ORYNI